MVLAEKDNLPAKEFKRLALIVDVVETPPGARSRMLTDGGRRRLVSSLTGMADALRSGEDELSVYKGAVDYHGAMIGAEFYPEEGLDLDSPISPTDEKIRELGIVRELAQRMRATAGPVEKETRIKILDARYQEAHEFSPSDSEVDCAFFVVLSEMAKIQEARIERGGSLKSGVATKFGEFIQVRRELNKLKLAEETLIAVEGLRDSFDRDVHFQRLTYLATGAVE